MPPVRLTAPALVDLPNGPDSTLGCLKLALLLVTDARGRYVLLVQSPNEHQQTLQVEVAGLPVNEAQAVLAELDQLRSELNVYRGHLLDVTLDPMGGIHLAFAVPPGLRRDDVVLPEAVLAGSNGTRSASPPTGRRCSPQASTSSAGCCSTVRQAPARRTRPATCSAR